MGNFSAYEDITADLRARTDWEQRQAQWYRMRHNGLRRRFKPYAGCADLHFPLIDSLIERLKAFYFQQLYATDTLASFVSQKQQDAELTTAVGAWFDFGLKQKTNFERKMLSVIDHMLLSAFCPMKIWWDDKAKCLRYAAINPIHLIVPKYTVEVRDLPRAVHVLHMSESDYKRNPNFNQDADFIKKIKGRGEGVEGNKRDDDVMSREGISLGTNDEEIVLWEVLIRESNGIKVQTYSPLVPNDEDKVRPDFMQVYDQGEFKSKDRMPLVVFQMEIKDEGWYSPRGVAEINAAFETSLCKMWNAKHDWMDFFNRPTFSSERELGNISNIRQVPGQILPPGVNPNVAPTPPMSFDEEMQSTRALAEYRTGIPDLGASSHFGTRPGYGGEKPTAHQISAIVGQSGIADDMRVRVFRMGLADAYRMSWSLRLQYDKESLDYVVGDNISQLDKTALHESYLIQPNGSADSWNKGLQMQKAAARLQNLANNPYVAQDELVKSVLELDEPRLVKRLYRDPGIQQQDQQTQQSLEIVLMLSNFGAPVHPSDDDKVHLNGLIQFGQMRMQEQNPITPIQAQLFGQHIEGHLNGLQQKKDKAFAQYRKQLAPFMAILQQLAASGQQPPQQPNVVQMPPQMPAAQAPSPAAASKAPDPQQNAAKLMQAIAALTKVGQPVGVEQLNAVLQEAGIPPIQLAPAPPAA